MSGISSIVSDIIYREKQVTPSNLQAIKKEILNPQVNSRDMILEDESNEVGKLYDAVKRGEVKIIQSTELGAENIENELANITDTKTFKGMTSILLVAPPINADYISVDLNGVTGLETNFFHMDNRHTWNFAVVENAVYKKGFWTDDVAVHCIGGTEAFTVTYPKDSHIAEQITELINNRKADFMRRSQNPSTQGNTISVMSPANMSKAFKFDTLRSPVTSILYEVISSPSGQLQFIPIQSNNKLFTFPQPIEKK